MFVIKSRPNETAETPDPYKGPPRTITGTLKIFKKEKKKIGTLSVAIPHWTERARAILPQATASELILEWG